MSFPRYSAYKDSGLLWPGEVPAHWDVVQVRHLARVEGGSTPDEEEILAASDEGHAWATPADMQGWHSELSSTLRRITDVGLASIGGLLAQPGDILFSCRAPVGKVAVVGQAMAFNQGCKAIIPKPGVHGRFLAWQLDAARSAFDLAARGTTFSEVSTGAIRAVFLSRPPLVEQGAIADFLDRETANLDSLTAEQDTLLTLLNEKRAAAIAHIVSKGLDPCVPMKDSGVEWLGDVPAHWEVLQARRLFQQSSTEASQDAEIVTCFRDGQVTLRRNRRQDGFTIAVLEVGYQTIAKGQLVLHSMDAFAGAIGVSDSDGKCSPEYIICEPTVSDVDPTYYGKLLRVMALRGFILAACPAVRERAPRIRFSNFAEMLLPQPPIHEQRAMAAYIDKETAKIDALAAEARASIALLRERRAALVSAAVTGRIDVRATASRDLGAAA